MIGEKMVAALNDQINAEMYSAYLYWSMSAYFEEQGLSGSANWMRNQALEEMTHADKFYNYLIDRGGRVLLSAIEAPPTQWDSIMAVFEATLEHEQKVTARINALMDAALKQNDHALVTFLQWFVNEQVEEEKSVEGILQQLRLIANAPGAMFMIDRELGSRTFAPPASGE